MMTEKKFFQEVTEKISKPNIVIVENRWDCASDEDEEMIEGVYRQHIERCSEFLIKDLGVVDPEDVENRIFFLSAKEALANTRKQISKSDMDGGQRDRISEFERFERLMKDCMTTTSVHTKFGNHVDSGKDVGRRLLAIYEDLENGWLEEKKGLAEKRRALVANIQQSEAQMEDLTKSLRLEVSKMLEEVETKLGIVYRDELKKLEELVDEFDAKFYDNPVVKAAYVNELERFLEAGVRQGLKSRLSRQISSHVQDKQTKMVEQIARHLPDIKRESFVEMLPSSTNFEIVFEVHSLAHLDFHHANEFKYSLGLFFWARKYLDKINSLKGIPVDGEEMAGKFDGPPRSGLVGLHLCNWATLSKILLLGLASQNTVAGMMVSGFVLRTTGWKVMVAIMTGHMALYLYEVMAWKTGGQEKELKKEYVKHLQDQLGIILPNVLHSCSNQIQQELWSTLSLVCRLMEETVDQLRKDREDTEDKLHLLSQGLDDLEELIMATEKNLNDLEDFEEKYLC